ncbi:MAG: hypothetical protein ACXW2P_03010 [Thermoanaerobaculia bacterium]
MALPSDRFQAVATLVSPGISELARWADAEKAGRCLLVQDVDLLDSMLRSPVMQATREVVRVIIDGSVDLDRFLLLVATLPDGFNGEILFIRRDGSGHLSTRDLKSKRTVRTITDADVEVYLRWHNLPARPRSSYVHEPASPKEAHPQKH